MTYTEQLGRLVSELRYGEIPDAVIEKLKTCLLYGLCMAAANPQVSTGLAAGRAVHQTAGPATAFLKTEQRHLSVGDAAWLNAYLTCARGQNDTFSDLYAHAGCIVIPVVLALAQGLGATGRQVLTAMAVGYEVLGLIASDASPQTVKRGFRATSVYGVFAAAAAAARLLNLPPEKVACALGLSTQLAAGTMQCWEEGTPEWQMQVGNAARQGLLAAQLAAAGHQCAMQSLEGKSGFYHAFADGPPPIGNAWQWKTLEIVFKPMPGCLINQTPLYLLLSLIRDHGIDEQNSAHIQVWLSEANANYPGTASYGPFKASAGAVMSGPFMLAAGLRQGKLRTSDFDALHGSGDIHALSRRIVVAADESLSGWACRIQVTRNDGTLVDASMADMSCFRFGWEESVDLLATTLDEWPLPDAARRFNHMQTLIRGLETAPDIHLLTQLMEP